MSRDGKKTGGRDFKPGQVANPVGAPKVPEHIKAIRKLTTKSFIESANRFIHLSINELEIVVLDTTIPAIDSAMAKMFLDCAKAGSLPHAVIDRLIGRVTDKIQHSMGNATVMKLRGEDAALIIGSITKNDEEE